MSSVKSSTGECRAHTTTPVIDPDLVRLEIDFWQELIHLTDTTTSKESLERMKQALALAQSKFAQCVDAAPPANNVYQIKRR